MLLQCLSKVEELKFVNMRVFTSEMQPGILNLPKLRKLKIEECDFQTPVVLNSIPADVLHELAFSFEPNDKTRFQSFFNRQKNIKKLEISNPYLISFGHLQLEHLKISSGVDFVVTVGQQPNLRYLDFTAQVIDDKVFVAVTKLANLEVLRIRIEGVSITAFRTISNLTKLRELRLESHSEQDYGHLFELSITRCDNLEKLTLIYTGMIPPVIFIQMSLNFSRLKAFEVVNRSINIVPTILEHFPLLESILLAFPPSAPDDVLVIDANMRHECLKQIVVTDSANFKVYNTRALLKLIRVSPNLEKIMLAGLKDLTFLDFKDIVEQHDNLTHLSLEWWPKSFEFTEDVDEVIKNAKKLVFLRFAGLTVYPNYRELREIFEEIFPSISLYEKPFIGGQVVMKKRNIPEWRPNDEFPNSQ